MVFIYEPGITKFKFKFFVAELVINSIHVNFLFVSRALLAHEWILGEDGSLNELAVGVLLLMQNRRSLGRLGSGHRLVVVHGVRLVREGRRRSLIVAVLLH